MKLSTLVRSRSAQVLITSVLIASASIGLGLTSAAQSSTAKAIFTGCDNVGSELQAGRVVETGQTRRTDPISNREFMSFSLEEVSEKTDGDTSCWQRLEGVWKEQTTIALDRTFDTFGWTSTSPDLVTLAHGVYTRPEHVVVQELEPDGASLLIQFPFSGEAPARYNSRDTLPLSQVLQPGGAIKIYETLDPSILPQFRVLEVDVSRTGYVRLRFDRVTFLRPRPGTSRSEWSGQISDRDPFMIGFTMENIVASRKGYDVVTQDPLRFLQNPKEEVFAHSRQGYAIDEKRIVPLGLHLVKEDVQGATYFSKAISSEKEYQSSKRSAWGVGVNISGPLKTKKLGVINLEAGFSYQSSKSSFQSLKNNSFVAEETGSMRHKKYALVLDPAYTQLSDAFIDAVDDAVRNGDYRQLVSRFGTHYPYAVTYGAAGQVSQFVTREGFERAYGSSRDQKYKWNGQVSIIKTNGFVSNGSSSSSSFSETNEYGEKVFTAVGGNGSWNEAGFVAGEAQYPILADLRPLNELLNEINFPGEPEVYIDGRAALARAINQYLNRHDDFSGDDLFPDLSELRQFEGCWSFVDKNGVRHRNLIRQTSTDTIVANRVSHLETFEYYLTQPNTFEAANGDGIYYFGQNGMATWRSPSSGLVLRLNRTGESC